MSNITYPVLPVEPWQPSLFRGLHTFIRNRCRNGYYRGNFASLYTLVERKEKKEGKREKEREKVSFVRRLSKYLLQTKLTNGLCERIVHVDKKNASGIIRI